MWLSCIWVVTRVLSDLWRPFTVLLVLSLSLSLINVDLATLNATIPLIVAISARSITIAMPLSSSVSRDVIQILEYGLKLND